jgi:3-deoxy-7-phosphoheptulonate synthase
MAFLCVADATATQSGPTCVDRPAPSPPSYPFAALAIQRVPLSNVTMEQNRGLGLPSLATEDDDGEETKLTDGSLFDSGTVIAEFTSKPYLVLVGGTQTRQVFVLDESETVIGRLPTCPIHIPDHGISREHVRIIREGHEYAIEDLGSANGTFLNGQRIEGRYSLNTGDRIRLGSNVLLRFEWSTFTNDEESPTSTAHRSMAWSPTSWETKPAVQQPRYDSAAELRRAVEQLRVLPPLVTSWEIERLKSQIAEAQDGERFLLQGGDCAEMFAECDAPNITGKLKILLQMSLILTHAARKPVIRVGRFAGQYAKPRSKPTEVRHGVELPSYVGDLVNRPEFTAEARRPDPNLLVNGYYRSALTLNFIRALCAGGFSDLRRPEYFDLRMFDREEIASNVRDEYARMSQQISEGLHFLRAMGDKSVDELARVEFFASHEGLNLTYESAQVRQVPRREGWYCLATHFPWIGERTRALNGAHIEFFRGIANPIGVKIGPTATPSDVVALLRALNPTDEPGKIVLIVRMGAGNVPQKLPPIIEAVTRARRKVLWVTDPMHGNGMVTATGIKTRDFRAILQEVEETFDTHEKCGSRLGGIHFELTGDNVTECIGGGLTEKDLDTKYMTTCDPRLNYRQAVEMAFCVARRIGTSSVRWTSSRPPSP